MEYIGGGVECFVSCLGSSGEQLHYSEDALLSFLSNMES